MKGIEAWETATSSYNSAPPQSLRRLNLSAIFSKTGKGVQEASGKTSNLSRADRTVLSAIDGKTSLVEVQKKFDKLAGPKFEALIQQLDKDGYIREVSSGAAQPAARTAPPAPRAAPPPAGGEDEALDFTQAIKIPPKAPVAPKSPPVDLAAASRAEAERKAKEQQTFDYKARQDAELKAKAEAKARAESEARARAEAEARARAAADAKALAEAEAKVKSAREAAVRMATEVKAKAEAEGKARTDAAEEREREALEKARRESADKARLEAELTGKLEHERRAREDAERRAREAADQARKDLEEKAKRDADELRQRLEAEMKAKLEEERKAREAEDRKRREEEDRKRADEDRTRAEEDRKRREEEEHRRKEEAERRAKEEAERKAREAEDRQRREEEDRKRREEDDRRRKEDEERRAKEAAERSARKEEEERRAKEETDRRKQDEQRRAKEEADRRAKEDAERRARDEQDSKRRKEEEERRAKEDADRRKREEAERKAKYEADAKDEAEAKARAALSASLPVIDPVSMPAPPAPAPAAPPPAAAGDIGDSLLADLESFGKREEEEQKAKEEADRKAKEAAARKAKDEAERKAKDDADQKRRSEEERRRKEEEERKAKEEAEKHAREEEERQKQEELERKRKAKEALAAKEAERKAAQRAAAAKGAGKDDDIGVTDDDLDLDDVKKDEKALSATARQAAREREQAPAAAAVRRPKKWGKTAAVVLFILLAGGIGFLHVMPLSTAEYEKAASEAMGVPVKIGSARLSVITGIEVRFEGVAIGDAVKIKAVQGYPDVGSLFGAKKSFSRMELEGLSLSQSQLAGAVLGKVSGENFRVARVVIKQAKFDGPLTLPPLDVDATVSGDGSLQAVSLRGGDKLSVQLSPKGNDIGFEISAGSLAVPFAPALNLSDFSMKGTANRGGVTTAEFDGRAFDGVISGSAKIRWGANWLVDGEVRARGVKVAVIAPALVSEGKVDGRGAYAMSGPNPATLIESARIQGEFKIEKGVLGSFDLTRALQTGGTQTGGRTIFSELTGQAVYDKGAVKITNVAIAAGAMNAGASLDVDANGGLSGRIVADVKTPNQTLRATLNVSGKIQEPVIRK